jgi:LemA protein
MKKGLVVIIAIVGILLIGYFWVTGIFNKMVSLEEQTSAQWANVESSYQRRADLIPNLVNTVKGYADFEKETLQAVVDARARATQTVVDPSNISPEELAEYQAAQSGVSSALSRLLAVVENYPDLKANQNFLELQSQLEGTENRINVERNKFNTVVQNYNGYIKRFPTRIFAGMFGFDEKGYFKSAAGTEEAPTVEF